MGARSLESRLLIRLLVLAGIVVVLACGASVALTQRVLRSADNDAARAHANALADALQREHDEGDSDDDAIREVSAQAASEGIRASLAMGSARSGPGPFDLDACGDQGIWRTCAVRNGAIYVAAGVRTDAHERVVAWLARAMAAVAVLALGILALLVRHALKEPARELRALTATAAHELRTPITAMLAEMDSAEPSRELVHRLRGDVERLADVVDSILVLSDPKHERSGSLVNVADLARAIATDVPLDAPDEVLVEGNERLIALALRNLIENAREHGGGAREIRLSRDGNAVEIAVADEGPGLSADAREKMFERHWRADVRGEGRGLGLAFVRAVAERHGGEARARAGKNGRGLEVAMTLGPIQGWA